jgi:hypothetical protein
MVDRDATHVSTARNARLALDQVASRARAECVHPPQRVRRIVSAHGQRTLHSLQRIRGATTCTRAATLTASATIATSATSRASPRVQAAHCFLSRR